MTLETAQILSSAAHLLGQRAPYKPTHLKHPCVQWAAASRGNWLWVVEHGLALADEYTRRYGKTHKSMRVLRWASRARVGPRDESRRRPFVACVPDQYRGLNPIEAYRRYYVTDKARFCTWRAPALPPPWWPR
jgi:hypothetical protein